MLAIQARPQDAEMYGSVAFAGLIRVFISCSHALRVKFISAPRASAFHSVILRIRWLFSIRIAKLTLLIPTSVSVVSSQGFALYRSPARLRF